MAAGFTACAPSSDSRKISVDAGFQVRSRAPYDMSERLTHLLNVAPNTCLQDQIYLVLWDDTTQRMVPGMAQQVILHSNVFPAPTPTQTPLYNASSSDIGYAMDWIANYSYIEEPLSMTVPNTPDQLETAVVGQFFNPRDAYNNESNSSGPDGICDQMSFANFPPSALHSSALLGHTPVSQAAGDVSLNVNVVHTNPSSP